MGRLVKGQGRVVPAVVMSARDEAERRLSEADAEIARRRAELEALEEEARRRGFAEGRRAGEEAARAEFTSLVAAARAYADEVRRANATAAVTLARRMAEKIVGRAVELAPEALGDVVTAALAASRAAEGRVAVRVNPRDRAAIERERPRLAARLPALEIQIVDDPEVEPSGCMVETPVGRLDARLSTQLDALERALLDRAGGGFARG